MYAAFFFINPAFLEISQCITFHAIFAHSSVPTVSLLDVILENKLKVKIIYGIGVNTACSRKRICYIIVTGIRRSQRSQYAAVDYILIQYGTVCRPVYIPGIFLCSRNLIRARKSRCRKSIQGYHIVILCTAKIDIIRCGHIICFHFRTAITISFFRMNRSGQRQTALFYRAFTLNLANIAAARIHKLIVTIIVIGKLQSISDLFQPVCVQISGIIAIDMLIVVCACCRVSNAARLVSRQNLTVDSTDQRFPTAIGISCCIINLGQTAVCYIIIDYICRSYRNRTGRNSACNLIAIGIFITGNLRYRIAVRIFNRIVFSIDKAHRIIDGQIR